jgi:hypothetical protein
MRDERRDADMPEDNVQTETTETVETTETAPETTETPEDKTEETVETPDTETVETKEETTETAEETKEETTTETEETIETPEDEDDSDDETDEDDDTTADESAKEVSKLKGQVKKEQKKVEALKGQVKGLEKVVSDIIESKMKTIPDEYHALVPEGNMVSKLEWINKAEQSGLFKAKANPDVEIGKPLNLGNKNEKATSTATAQQKLSNYFSNLYSK